MKRVAIIALVVCLVLGSVFGAGTKESKKDEMPTLEFWTVHENDSSYMEIFQRASEIAEAEHGFKVDVVFKGTGGFRELATQAAFSQSGPDLIFNWTGKSDIITSGKQGLHLPLNDYFTQEEIDSLQLLEGCTDPDTGAIYGSVFANNFVAVAYNKEMMTKAGVDYTKFPAKWSYDEFLEVSRKVKAAGMVPFGFANKEGFFAHWWHSYAMPSYVDNVAELITNYEKPLYTDNFIDFSEKWKAYYDKGYYFPGGNTISIANLWGQFTSGQVAMISLFPSLLQMYTDALGVDNVGIIEWPSMGGSGSMANLNPIFGDSIGATKWTKYPKQAAQYIKILLFNEEIVEALVAVGNPPVSTKFSMNDFSITNDELKAYIERHDEMGTLLEGHAFWSREYDAAILKFCNMMITGELTPKQYAEEIEASMK
ncbi:MAG: ABC transporter substrate-binding protein [Sphaerochaeta sp.]|nr:ABC transporter substrate-binding protein [Sphaerochaeta sp.]